MTEKYCLDRGIPFPRIEVLPEDLEEPRECYLFTEAEDPRSPIVLHFPLVNRTFRTHLAPGEGRRWAGVWSWGAVLRVGFQDSVPKHASRRPQLATAALCSRGLSPHTGPTPPPG